MINANKKKLRIWLLVTVLVSVAAGAFRAFLLVNFIEPETGFYVHGTNLATVFALVAAAVLVVTMAAGFRFRKVPAPENFDSRRTAVVFSSALCAFVYLSVLVSGLVTLFSAKSAGLFLILELLLCIPCIFNHIAICSVEVRKKDSHHAILAMCGSLFFAVRIIEVFMNKTTQINTSQRSLELVLLCAIMMFLLTEASSLITGEFALKNLSRYIAAALSTVAMVIVAVIPYLAVSVFWVFRTNFVVMDILECCIALYAASRVLTIHD